MEKAEMQQILIKSKEFFRKRIAENHKTNTMKLVSLNKFNVNPFIHKYLANFAFGNTSSINLAKVLIYPRVLGTSISTTFGTQLQYFCNEVLVSYASMISGIDIEFVDALDGRKKYCQVKSGPQTINHDDIATICNHFINIKNLARTNRVPNFNPLQDCIVGVFYGTQDSLSQNYKDIQKQYTVFCGKEFWYHLTGDENFYEKLINTFAEVADEINCSDTIENVIQALAKEIEKQQ